MNEENARTEIVQIAAVAVSIAEDLGYGSADASREHPQSGYQVTSLVLDEVKSERERQDQKWGPQHHPLIGWLMILMEEVGELAEDTPVPDEIGNQAGSAASIRMNIIHAGQEAKKWLERNLLSPS